MPGGAVLYVKDLGAMRSFHERCFGLEVVEAEAERHCVMAGGTVEPPGTTWKFRGRLHRDSVDPEGNVVQVRQPQT